MIKTHELIVTGSIQGVGFRPYIYRIAKSNNITGYVQNNGNFVKIIAQGIDSDLDSFYKDIYFKKPPLAFIENITKKIIYESTMYSSFSILKSDVDSTVKSTSYIPPDTTICENCLSDMNLGDRIERKNYPFTSCVDCGPRYSIINSLPYDRPLTTMNDFTLCDKCQKEYSDPSDRRFHAQTTCCSKCGPKYSILDRFGKIIEGEEGKIVEKTQELLLKGKIIAIKGIGGTHLACKTDDYEVIQKLRESKGDRLHKPFAVMSYSLSDIRKFAIIENSDIENLLKSPRRPIVLLKKNDPFPLASNVAPYLHNIGVMLPYSGFHYQLLANPLLHTLIMTSANKSHLPIEISNDEIIGNLSDIVDNFVLHNRIINQRVDDSVVKPFFIENKSYIYSSLIRRSRGFTPEPIDFPPFMSENLLVGLGSEMHTTPALLTQGKIFFTQYIGNLRYEKTFNFYKESIDHVKNLLQRKEINGVAHDIHPLYLSSEYATDLKNAYTIPALAFQHHFAHAASLLVDNSIFDEQAIIITADGLGLGTDNAIWGGEVLSCDLDQYTRLDHISYVHQPGGDIATKYPVRMLLSYLYANKWNETEISQQFPNLKQNFITNVIGQIQHQINSPVTSSTGRFLDTCSNLLGLCNEETYEGEPAIILEGFGWKAIHTKENNPIIEFSIKNDLGLNFKPLIPFIIELQNRKLAKEKIAYFIQDFVGWAFGSQALSLANNKGIRNIGFTGGVAFNEIIIRSFVKTLEDQGDKLKILLHKQISPGDGGLAGGQVALLSQKLK